jgi:hypothetical protein
LTDGARKGAIWLHAARLRGDRDVLAGMQGEQPEQPGGRQAERATLRFGHEPR